MNESRLKTRSAVIDIILTIYTALIWGIWVLWSLHKNVSVIENECDIKSKPGLEAFDAFLIIVYGAFFIFPLAMATMFLDVSQNTFSENFLMLLVGFFRQLYLLAFGVIWIGARHIRRRILKIVEVEDYKSGYFALIGFSWLAAIFFAFTMVIAPLVTLYRTIRMYNQLAGIYNEQNHATRME